MNFRKKIFLFIFFAFLFFYFFTNGVEASQVSSPTIIEVGNKRSKAGINQPYIKGLTRANTEILVYINGIYSGLAKIGSENNETDSFYYAHLVSLAQEKHIITIIARDKTSLVLSSPVETEFISLPLSAPTLVSPDKDDVIGEVKPFITGLTVSNSFVHIYIDGVYNGKTEVLKHNSGTSDFAYKPFLNLEVGGHKVWVVAENEWGEKSKISNVLNFKIEEPMPAPTLFTPVVNSETNYSHPFVVGLAKNDSLIKIYIDHRFDGQFRVANHKSGTANFAHKPFRSLTRGSHLVYTTATDNRGKESKWSNIIYFTVRQPTIAKSVQEEKKGVVVKIEESVSDVTKEPPIIISPEEGTVVREETTEFKITEKGVDEQPTKKDGESLSQPSDEVSIPGQEESGIVSDITDEEIKKIIEGEIEEQEEKSGLINEAEKKQSKLGLNLIIFIVFLLGIIAWIFWVNRELIKEKKAQRDALISQTSNKEQNKQDSSQEEARQASSLRETTLEEESEQTEQVIKDKEEDSDEQPSTSAQFISKSQNEQSDKQRDISSDNSDGEQNKLL